MTSSNRIQTVVILGPMEESQEGPLLHSTSWKEGPPLTSEFRDKSHVTSGTQTLVTSMFAGHSFFLALSLSPEVRPCIGVISEAASSTLAFPSCFSCFFSAA